MTLRRPCSEPLRSASRTRVGRSRPFGTIINLPSGRYRARYWQLRRQVSAPFNFATKADAGTWLAGVESDITPGTPGQLLGRIGCSGRGRREVDEPACVATHTRETYE
jgi:hypothetical protein